jgi:aspartate aminotransferase
MAAIEAIKSGDQKVDESRGILKDRCDLFYTLLKDVPGFKLTRPEGAFYVWPDISFYMNKKYKGESVPDSKTFASLLLRDYHVATIPGQFFGMPGYLRFSFAVEKKRIEEAVSRIRSFIADFN